MTDIRQTLLTSATDMERMLRSGTSPATGDRIALRHHDQVLDYATLEARATSVAAGIKAMGQAAPVIGLALPRGIDAAVAMLAILRAGGTCVPCDPHHPPAYLADIFTRAGCALVIADTDLPSLTCPVQPLASLESQAKGFGTVPDTTTPGFILFTSGTTGTPKGVVLGLNALCATAIAFGERTGVTCDSVVAQYASLSFDAATLECLLAYLHGAQLCILPDEARTDPEMLGQTMHNSRVTHLILPAAVAPYLPLRDDYALRALICVGDALDEKTFHAWAHKYPTFNGYGPTEAAICTSLHRVTPGAPITLGAPLDHLDMRIGDEAELLIGGPGLALGYLNDLDQTAARFRPDAVGALWYHTGDLVTEAEDGTFAFAGRADFQVKIRGVRIETGALELALRASPGVEDAAVVACGAGPQDKFLAAFIAQADGTLDAARAAIASQFPASHMPRSFHRLDRLPVTVNGKIDRRALAAVAAPQGVETTDPISAAFCAAAGVVDCDAQADFFQLGGDSIAAMRLLAQLGTTTGTHVPVKAFRQTPTVAGLRALIDKGTTGGLVVTKGRRTADILPLSPQQNAAWYMFQQDPTSKAYLAEAVHHFSGPLNIAALDQALQRLIARHEIYRTIFFAQDGVPMQQILPEYQAQILHVAADHVAPADRAAFLRDVIRDKMPGITDLGQLPLANFTLVTFGPEEHALIHQEHHIIHDGWGGSAFTAELLNDYHALTGTLPDAAPQPTPQYSDFLLTQAEWLGSDDAAAQRAYWVDQLQGAPQSVAIFGKASTAPGFDGDYCRLDFSRAEWDRCETLCRDLGVTPFGFTTAVLNLLLWQYSGQTDIVVGSPFANRNWQNSQGILGMLVNTLVLRQRIDTAQPVTDFIRATQATINDAYANQEFPFSALVEAINPERLNGQNPLFNVLLGFHDAPIPVAEVDGFRWRKDETVISHTSKFDLDCLVVNRDSHFTEDNAVSFLWEYRADVYEKAEIADFVDSFRHVFLTLCDGVSGTLADLSVLTPEQGERVLGWGQGAPAEPTGEFLTDLMISIAAAGDRIALQTTDASLAYRDLARQSGAVAGALADHVNPGDRVAVIAPRGIEQVVAMLGVMRLRATIVCLEPGLPPARMTQLIADCAPTYVLHTGGNPTDIAGVAIADAIATGGTAPERAAQPGAIAYITYTSGSTGQPKGVEIYASALADECQHLISVLDLSPEARVLSLSYCGFDAYHGEIWPALMAGARVVLVSDSERDTLPRLATIMADTGITSACFPTGLVEEAFATGITWPDTLKTLATGGDRLGPVQFPPDFHARFFNLYGPTETTIDATFYQIEQSGSEAPPIGRPALGTTARVLSGDTLCPPGAPGELVIGGSGVARGYLNRPEETARAFITLSNGARYYRTGDQVRWDQNGQLIFLGRIDDEISLRGYRIAPAEITAALNDHAEVAQAAVAVKNGALFAYVTTQGDSDPARLSRKLKVHLKQRLPQYMRPNAVIVLDRLPLTDQGKVDTRALPSPLADPVAFEAPATLTEHALTALWQAVLPVEQISVTQNFFAIGGHSLLAMRLIATITSQFGVTLRINDFFDNGTVRGLAEQIDLIRAATAETGDSYVSEGEF